MSENFLLILSSQTAMKMFASLSSIHWSATPRGSNNIKPLESSVSRKVSSMRRSAHLLSKSKRFISFALFHSTELISHQSVRKDVNGPFEGDDWRHTIIPVDVPRPNVRVPDFF